MEETCSVCNKKEEMELDVVLSPNLRGYFICSECTEKGFWYDPAGGLHSPDEEPEDYARAYE